MWQDCSQWSSDVKGHLQKSRLVAISGAPQFWQELEGHIYIPWQIDHLHPSLHLILVPTETDSLKPKCSLKMADGEELHH